MALQRESRHKTTSEVKNVVSIQCNCLDSNKNGHNQNSNCSSCKINNNDIPNEIARTKFQDNGESFNSRFKENGLSDEIAENEVSSKLDKPYNTIDQKQTEDDTFRCTSKSQNAGIETEDNFKKTSDSCFDFEKDSGSDIGSSSSIEAPTFPPRKPFKPRGRMFKSPPEKSNQFIMDVPDAFGIGMDGSMMTAFNKLEIKD